MITLQIKFLRTLGQGVTDWRRKSTMADGSSKKSSWRKQAPWPVRSPLDIGDLTTRSANASIDLIPWSLTDSKKHHQRYLHRDFLLPLFSALKVTEGLALWGRGQRGDLIRDRQFWRLRIQKPSGRSNRRGPKLGAMERNSNSASSYKCWRTLPLDWLTTRRVTSPNSTRLTCTL